MRWIEVTIEASVAAEEAVANALIDAGCGGVAIVGSSVFVQEDNPYADIVPKELVEPSGVVQVLGYLPLDDSFERRLDQIRGRVGGLTELGLSEVPSEMTIRPVDDEDWATAWKAFFKPFKVGRIVVKPTWEDYTPQADDIILELDPGMAFGTGTHATTQLCLLALQKYVKGGESVLDMGCGSGILAIAAAKLGAGRVTAVDIDPVATKTAEENVSEAGLQEQVEVVLGNEPVRGQFDLVIANIIADTIISLSDQLKDALLPGGLLISSGIILEREQDVRSRLEAAGLETVEAAYEGEWVAFVSRRIA